MSCLQIALKELGIIPEKYYASEIDKYAIAQTQLNFPDTIQLGSVTEWETWDIDWSTIDLIGAGSPCQGFSFAGKQLAFDDPRSKLFFVFVDILNHCKKYNPKVKFLLENVNMKQEHMKVINNYVGLFGQNINSNLVSAQNRSRNYWSNIRTKKVGLFDEIYTDIPQPKDQGILLRDILETEVDEKYFISQNVLARIERKSYSEPQFNPDKTGTLNTKNNSGQMSIDSGTTFISVLNDNGVLRETEKANCIDANYWKGMDNHAQRSMIVAMRGRENGQELEPNTTGKTNCLTSVQKDNLVMMQIPHGFNKGGEVAKDGKTPPLTKSSWEQNNLVVLDERQQNNFKSGEEKANTFLSTSWKGSRANGMTLINQSRIRRLTPLECARLQTVPDWYVWKSLEINYQFCIFAGNQNTVLCQDYAKQKIVISQSQIKQLDYATNIITGLLDTALPNYQDLLSINLKNAKWKVAREPNKPVLMSVSCTISDLKDTDFMNYLKELTNQNLNVNFAIKRLENQGCLECVTNITKCGNFTETLYIPMKEDQKQDSGDILGILMENNFIEGLLKRLSEGSSSKELKLYTMSILINLIITQVIWSFSRNPSMHLYINSSIELQGNSLELKLSYIEMGRTISTSDTAIYKMLGNGWTVSVISWILSFLPQQTLVFPP